VKERSGVWNDDHWGLELPKPNKVLSWTAHLVVVFGTFIWGFGDWLLPSLFYGIRVFVNE